MLSHELKAMILLYHACEDAAVRGRVLELVPDLAEWVEVIVPMPPKGKRWTRTGCGRCGFNRWGCECAEGFLEGKYPGGMVR